MEPIHTDNYEGIDCLTIIENFVSKEEEDNLVKFIWNKGWSDKFSTRRTQQYGFEYPTNRTSGISKYNEGVKHEGFHDIYEIGEISCLMMKQRQTFDYMFNQCLVSEYNINDSVSKLSDDSRYFDEIISIVSLRDVGFMSFKIGRKKRRIVVRPRSLLLLRGRVRYEYKYDIMGTRKLELHGVEHIKNPIGYKRITITMRKVKDSFI